MGRFIFFKGPPEDSFHDKSQRSCAASHPPHSTPSHARLRPFAIIATRCSREGLSDDALCERISLKSVFTAQKTDLRKSIAGKVGRVSQFPIHLLDVGTYEISLV